MSLPQEIIDCLSASICEFLAENSAKKLREYKANIFVVIGFVGDIKGALSVGMNLDLLSQTHPMQEQMELGEADLVEWAGEVGNQILGRFKNSLLKFGINFTMATPTILQGENMSSFQSNTEEIFCDWIEQEAKIYVHLAAKMEKEVDFSKQENTDGPNEGDSIFF